MKLKYLLTCLLAFFISTPINAQEGLGWWMDAKRTDFIVEGTIDYEPTKYYELNGVNVEGKSNKYYWLAGRIKINKILYINKYSQHLEEFQLYLKNTEKEYSVLIPAFQSATFSTHSTTKKVLLRPVPGVDIIKESTILNLSEVYIYPILDLKIESVVPIENVQSVREMVEKRPNNYLSK